MPSKIGLKHYGSYALPAIIILMIVFILAVQYKEYNTHSSIKIEDEFTITVEKWHWYNGTIFINDLYMISFLISDDGVNIHDNVEIGDRITKKENSAEIIVWSSSDTTHYTLDTSSRHDHDLGKWLKTQR